MVCFRIGDIVDEAVYGKPASREAPMLLLARGQKIESQVQLRRLREAGYPVAGLIDSRPDPRRDLSPASLGAGRAAKAAAPTFEDRLAASQKLRKAVQIATRDLYARISQGSPPDLQALMTTGTQLTSQVVADPYGFAVLTALRQCDDYTLEHSADVSILMVALGHVLHLPETELRDLAVAGLLHDVGKQRIHSDILEKPGKLTDEEFAVIKNHALWGYELVTAAGDCPERVARVVIEHHERVDGTGYPYGLKRSEIDPFSLIAAVADVFDAMTADRVYRQGISPRAVLQVIFGGRDSHFDSDVVAALVKLVGVYPVGTPVLLSSGEHAIVIEPNPRDTTRPIIEILQDRRSRPLPFPRRLDLQASDLTIIGTE